MKAFYSDHFTIPLPDGHRFPIAKYAQVRERAVAGIPDLELAVPPAAGDDELARAHSLEYIRHVTTGTLPPAEQRRLGFPWSEALVERSRRSVGATLAASRAALTDGVAVTLAGGTHHAFATRGEGYCVFNDVGVTALTLLAEGSVQRVLVVDLAVHQGNGTAAMFAGVPSVATLDLYAARNFPFTKEPADIDVPLEDETDDAGYLSALDTALPRAFTKAAPDLVIYLAGADPHEGDRLGRLALTRHGLAERDAMVLDACQRHHVPVAITMAGGYGRNLEDTVDIHVTTIRAAAATAPSGIRP